MPKIADPGKPFVIAAFITLLGTALWRHPCLDWMANTSQPYSGWSGPLEEAYCDGKCPTKVA